MNSLGDGPTSAHAARSSDSAAPRGCRLHLGCAGWNVPRAFAGAFGAGTSQLARYATRFHAVEINSSFYRPHRWQTYERWASSTPPDFAFSVILPQAITHETRLVRAMPVFDPFWDQVQGLGERLRCLLVQLSPSLAYDSRVAGRFGAALRRRYAGPVEIEPRHASWFTHQVDALLASWRFGRVLADPVRMTRERHRADGCGPSTCVCTDRRACIGSATKTHCSACSRRDCGGGRRCRALLVHFRQFRGRPIRRRRASARRDDWMVHQMRKAGPPFEPLDGAAGRNGDSSAVVADLDMSTLPQGKGHVHTAGRLCGSCEEVRWIRRSGSRATR